MLVLLVLSNVLLAYVSVSMGELVVVERMPGWNVIGFMAENFFHLLPMDDTEAIASPVSMYT